MFIFRSPWILQSTFYLSKLVATDKYRLLLHTTKYCNGSWHRLTNITHTAILNIKHTFSRRDGDRKNKYTCKKYIIGNYVIPELYMLTRRLHFLLEIKVPYISWKKSAIQFCCFFSSVRSRYFIFCFLCE